MSSFTLGLVILGALVLAVLVAWNTWSMRRNTPRQPDAVAAAVARVDINVEPILGLEPGDGPARTEPVFDDTLTPLPLPEKKPGLDALIDVIAPIVLEALVSGEAALAALPPTRRAGSKPFAIEGWNEATQHWETPHAGQRYAAFQAGVQLANRTGALNEIEYSEFVVKTQAFCDAVGGMAEIPEMRHEIARARELDQFASGHDAQLGFTLRARNAAWSPGYVQQNAARLGFLAGAMPGRLVLPAGEPGHPPVLGLSFDTQAAMADDPAQSAIRDITLSVDVPQVERGEQPFDRLRDVAITLAGAMDGVLTDDNGDIIRPDALDGIAIDLEHLYDTLEARDLSAGSAQARRLFS